MVINETKKLLVLNAVSLGMNLDKAFILAELTEAEQTFLLNDVQFNQEVVYEQAVLERDLLQRHNDCIEKAILKGNGKPIEWRLGKVNPEKWGEESDHIVIPGKLVLSEEDNGVL